MSGVPGLRAGYEERVAGADWAAVARALDDEGGALLPPLLTPAECAELAGLYDSGAPGLFRAGQTRPTPLLLRYGAGDWNALHRDLYGDKVFPLQVVINLNDPGRDHTGGEFLLVEQRPRAQSRGSARLVPRGHGLVFTTRDRPVRSARGWSAAPVRHGVSVIRSGQRHTLGLLFHDAA
jgi:hypothetical protein